MVTIDATYCVGDNKIRLYPSARLDAETYARVKESGYCWAPKQELFVAPRWTPAAEDIAIELAGDIDDEDMTPAERAASRADRFEGYQGKRAAEAHHARAAVANIADNLPLGQPILCGHHSERHARRDAEKIESGMRRTVKLWETSTYWASRAAGAIAHARYVELPAVRARRIKKLEAEKRGHERDIKASSAFLALWKKLDQDSSIRKASGQPSTFQERAAHIANLDRSMHGLWSEIESGKLVPAEAQARYSANHERIISDANRWIAHIDNRLTYERAMLGESGYVEPEKPKGKSALPILNYSGKVAYRARHSREIVECEATPITKSDLARINKDYKGTVISACGTHRLRTAMLKGHTYGIVYLTDSKQHPRPSAEAVQAKADEMEASEAELTAYKLGQAHARLDSSNVRAAMREQAAAEAAPFEAVKQALKAGVQVVAAPQLFPTPPALAARMVELAGIEEGDRVLEPSAGTGNILRAIADADEDSQCNPHVVAIEINRALVDALPKHLAKEILCADFLAVDHNQVGRFDKIIANPPFGRGADIEHVKHTLRLLMPTGRLVVICSNGPRQQAELRPLATTWEELPDGIFADQGTNVRTVLMTVQW